MLDVGRGSVDFAAVARQRATTQVALVALALFAFGALVLARVAGGDGVDSASRAPATRAALPPPSIVTTGSAIPSASAGTASSTSSPASPVGLPSSAAAPGGIPAAPTASVRLYTVRAGDTLAAIARRFGTSVGRIRSANEIADPRTLRIGQTLRIP